MTDLGAHILAQTVSRLEGKTTANMPIFSSINLGTNTIVRSATCWAADLDLSCLAHLSGNTYKGTFITRRHVVYPFHIGPSGTLNFLSLGTDGVVRTHSASGWTRVGTTDMCVGVLSADLPSAVNPATILPTTYAAKFVNDGLGLPVLTLHQDNKAAITKIAALANGTVAADEADLAQPTSTPFSTFYIATIAGDSGHPAFVIIDGVPVAVYSGLHGITYGPNPANSYSALLAVIDTLSPGGSYRPTIADLTAFFTYEGASTPLALESVSANDGWTANGGGNLIAAATGTAGMTCTNSGSNVTVTFETTPTGPATTNAYNFNISFTVSITETLGDLDTNLFITLLSGEAGLAAGSSFTVPTTTTDEAFSATMTLSGVTPTTLAGAQLVFDAYGTASTWTIKNLAITYDYDAPVAPTYAAASDVRLDVDRGDGTLGTLVTVSPAAVSGQTTGYVTCYTKAGALAGSAAASITIELLATKLGTAGLSFSQSTRTATCDANGLVQITGMLQEAWYRAKRDSGGWTVPFQTAAATTSALPEVLGVDA